MENTVRKGYIKSFQGLRVIAAVMVFLCHTGSGIVHEKLGSAAVAIFFILSGFLAQNKSEHSDNPEREKQAR